MLAVLRQEPAAPREFDSFMSGLGHKQTQFHPLARSASTLQAYASDLSNVGAAGEIFPDWLAARLLAAGMKTSWLQTALARSSKGSTYLALGRLPSLATPRASCLIRFVPRGAVRE
jgi:hypothetical protein